jgi:hypothetical protein
VAMEAFRNPGLRLIHAAEDGERTICKHYRVAKMEPVTDFSGPFCTDCYSALRRKEQDGNEA